MRNLLTSLALVLFAAAALGDAREDAARLNEEGIRQIGAGEFEKAIDSFGRARTLLPTDKTLKKNLATARSRYGAALLKDGKTAEGIRQLRMAAYLEPGLGLHHANLGAALIRSGDREAGRKALEKAILVDPACASARAEMGSLLYREGELERAILEWEKTLILTPDRKDIRQALGRAKREFDVEGTHTREESAHFLISWDGDKDASVGARILRILEDAYEETGAALGIFPKDRVRVILYGEKEFQAVTGAHSWVGGLFDGRIRIPVKNFASAERDIRSTIFHEYTHVVVQSVTTVCPSWLNEGLAQYYEKKDPRPSLGRVAQSKRGKGLLSLAELRKSFTRFEDPEMARQAYAQSLLLTRFLLDEHGPDRVGRFLRDTGEGKTEKDAAESAFHRSLEQIEAAWVESI